MSTVRSRQPATAEESARRIYNLLSRLCHVREESLPVHLLTIGKLAYGHAMAAPETTTGRDVLALGHGALSRAVSLLRVRSQQHTWAEACYFLGLICLEVARQTRDLDSARRSYDLLAQSSANKTVKYLTEMGLMEVSPAQAQLDQLARWLLREQPTIDRQLLERLTPGTLVAGAAATERTSVEWYQRRLQQAYHLPAQGAGPLDRIRQAAIRLLSAPRPLVPLKSTVHAGSALPLALLGTPPGLKAEIRWPDTRIAEVKLAIVIQDRDEMQVPAGTAFIVDVVAEGVLPEGLPWANWLATPGAEPRRESLFFLPNDREQVVFLTDGLQRIQEKERQLIESLVERGLLRLE